ncbi:hypothetical protein AA958_30915 [Streptomyces sp. CNQ-509]|uniref:peptidoglycan-binding domain-containing protein n=1 Tax=Streptomyces sp. CNQ-509 TaxID=444103 RepID=UPI00062DF634|nr:peptidoglycan-binding domain-containing protein [Streptomyces sp. CNQ-509]AKH85893.1 hypothetical protein AA958_30915 [Streptomyces sp. CNQ-509]
MRATEAGGGQDADGGSEPGPGTELLPVPRAAFLPQVAPGSAVARIEAAQPEPDDTVVGGGHRRRPTGLLLAAGGAAAVIAGLVVTAGLLTGGPESDEAGPGPARISTGPSGGGEADGGPLGDDEGAPADGTGAHPDDRAGRDRGDGNAPPAGRRAAGDDHAGDLAPGRTNGQIGSIAPTAPPAYGASHPPPSSSPTDGAPAVPVLPPVLGPGDSGPEVTELQHRLRQVGLGLLQPADGAYDDGVRTSVRTFQSVNNLEEDERGVYGPETRRELESRTDEP